MSSKHIPTHNKEFNITSHEKVINMHHSSIVLNFYHISSQFPLSTGQSNNQCTRKSLKYRLSHRTRRLYIQLQKNLSWISFPGLLWSAKCISPVARENTMKTRKKTYKEDFSFEIALQRDPSPSQNPKSNL